MAPVMSRFIIVTAACAALAAAAGAQPAPEVPRAAPAQGAPARPLVPGAQAPGSQIPGSQVPGSQPPGVQPQQQQGSPAIVPGFWDPRRRPERPDLARLSAIRFMTEVDYPPFNYAGPDGNPTGFNVELARMICEELKVNCTVQMRRFDTLLDSLDGNRGDAAIASISVSPETRKRADFSDPYYRPTARFAVRAKTSSTATSSAAASTAAVTPESMEGRKVAVVAGSAHEQYLKTLFTEANVRPYPDAAAAREALRTGEVDYLFGDGFALSFWLNGQSSSGCCAFAGGAFIESRYFGEGIGIAVKRGNDTLRRAINYALFRIWETGRFTDLWLRYFPVSPF
jgi:polar amino acid transport system substrate-binding protein